ncbi:NADPH-dependent FMN reductase [Egicoccus sp. AB-alg2]|uniref:NADPH-dependent FMN reductase n=1 Tax=Egicoccus sp. AB-alg2 TaxID=3242693 RepID=UPI00359DB085
MPSSVDRSTAPTLVDAREAPLDLAVVLASTPRGRTGPRIADWFLGQLGAWDGFAAELMDLADIGADPDRFRKLVDGADAVVLVVPEYNHSFPGPLKTAIDALRREWFAKPVGVVSYGGVSGGLRATEQLRLVLAELHAVVVRETVSFHGADAFDAQGRPREPGVAPAADRFLTVLAWWARNLRQVRRHDPYPPLGWI